MVVKTDRGLQVLLDYRRFLPSLKDLRNPLPAPQKGELVMQGVTADVLSYAVGFIPGVGDVAADFVNDNIMADVNTKLTPAERLEYEQQNRIWPNGIALWRTFQRVK